MKQGFTQVIPVVDELLWNGISIHRTSGQHGTGEIGKLMGRVSDFVLSYGEQTLYITGDPITMTTENLLQLTSATRASVTVVHLETINHCLQKRGDFSEVVHKNNLQNRVNIPADGDWFRM